MMKKVFFLLLMLGLASAAIAQPVLTSRQLIEGIAVYKDYKRPFLYYYGPGALALAKSDAQRPAFQLTQMRYTGSSCSADQGEKSFLNLVQFNLEMEALGLERTARIRAKLRAQSRRPVRLVPMPLRYIQTFVLLPVASNQPPQRVGAEGVADIDPKDGSFWKEKSFNFRLTNAESQLLSEQIKEKHLTISVGYSFYSDAILGGDGEMSLSGSKEDIEEMLKSDDWGELLKGDTLAIPRVFHAGTMTFDLDLEKHPDLIKQIDINEGLPPDYPAVEIRCYDFRDDLRPDLALKRVEIAGVGIGGKPLSPQAVQFSKRASHEYVKNFRFPFAVRMDEDMQYRITSYTLKGEREASEWISRPICEGLIDLTTTPEENPLKQFSVAFETDEASLDSAKAAGVELLLGYELNGKAHVQRLELRPGGGLYGELSFTADKENQPWFSWNWTGEEAETKEKELLDLDDSYYFLKED